MISKIKYVHNTLKDKVTYALEDECSGANKNNVSTSYGALVNGEAGFDGYAKAMKVILDKLQVPCVLVQGVCETENSLFEVYMWNYVQIDNKWYAIDTSLDDRLGENSVKYLLVGEEMISKDHVTIGKLTNDEFSFGYPVLETNGLSNVISSDNDNNSDTENNTNNDTENDSDNENDSTDENAGNNKDSIINDNASGNKNKINNNDNTASNKRSKDIANISYVSKVKYEYNWSEFNRLNLHATKDISMNNWKTADGSTGISNDLKDRMAIIVSSLSSSEASVLNTKVRQDFQDDKILQGAFYDINLMVGDKKVSRTGKNISISADFPNRI